MNQKRSERGQALILIVFAIIGLIGMTALTVDGGMAYSDRRYAQNAADNAAFAAALAYGRGRDITAAAQSIASSNGFESSKVTVETDVVSAGSGVCPGDVEGREITVQITSPVDTYFGPVIGINTVTNVVTATTRACGTYVAPLFDGNAIISLSKSGKGFDATGNPKWIINGGGILSNSSSCPSVYRNGAAQVSVETGYGITAAGCIQGISGTIPQQPNAHQYELAEFQSMFPRTPACDGTATFSGGQWHPENGKDGSNVSFSGDMNFASGLYCVTNSPGPFHGAITGTGVTFYITSPNFQMKFSGGGNLTASAPTSGGYAGILMYLAPQISNGQLLNTQAIDMRGNGSGTITGSIIAPSADVTMFGNSGTAGFHSQIIAYQVDAGGSSDQLINYEADENYQTAQPVSITLLK